MNAFWHIYTLADAGKVFYVGISRNIEKRYKGHLSCQDLCTSEVIYWMRQEERLPQLEILHYAHNQQQAEIAETAVIAQLCIMGNKLCNVDVNPLYNQLITCNPYPNRTRIKRISKNIVPKIIKAAKDRYHRRILYNDYATSQNRFQYLGNTARVS